MTLNEVAANLQHFNDWRRGHHDEQPDPRVIGEAIDAAVEMIDRLEAAEKERDAAELMSLALRAKIEQMEKQEPVAWMLNCPTLGGDTGWILSWTQSGAGLCNRLQGEENEKRLYALPGAQPAPSVPDSIIADAARYQFLRNGGAYLEPNEGEIYMATDYGAKYYKDLRDLDMDIDEAIAAPPEAKP